MEARSQVATPLTPAQARDAGRFAQEMRAVSSERAPDEAISVLLDVDGRTDKLELPVWAVSLVADVLDDLSTGREVTAAPADVLVGTSIVAGILGVSEPWVRELIDRGELPLSKMEGTKRRVRLGDVVTFRRADERRRRAAADADWSFLDETGS